MKDPVAQAELLFDHNNMNPVIEQEFLEDPPYYDIDEDLVVDGRSLRDYLEGGDV